MYVLLCFFLVIFFFKQKTAYEMRISDWSSDVCSSDLPNLRPWRWRALETTELEHDPNERHYGDLVKYGHCLSAEKAAYRPVAEECRQPKDHLCAQQLWPQEEGHSIGQKW